MIGPRRKMDTSSPEEKVQRLGVFYVGVLRNLKVGWRRFQASTWLLVQISPNLTYLQFQASKVWCQCLEHEPFMFFYCHINIYNMNIDTEVICDLSTGYRQILILRELCFCSSDLLTLEVSKCTNVYKI